MLRRLLMELTMKGDLYDQNQARPAAEQILLMMSLTQKKKQFRIMQKQISEMDVSEDMHQYLSSLENLQKVRKEIDVLIQQISPTKGREQKEASEASQPKELKD